MRAKVPFHHFGYGITEFNQTEGTLSGCDVFISVGSSSATGLDWRINEGAGICMVSFKVSANGALTVAFVGVQGLTCGELR